MKTGDLVVLSRKHKKYKELSQLVMFVTATASTHERMQRGPFASVVVVKDGRRKKSHLLGAEYVISCDSLAAYAGEPPRKRRIYLVMRQGTKRVYVTPVSAFRKYGATFLTYVKGREACTIEYGTGATVYGPYRMDGSTCETEAIKLLRSKGPDKVLDAISKLDVINTAAPWVDALLTAT